MCRKQRYLTSLYLLYQDEILLLFRQNSRVNNGVWIASAGGHVEASEMNDVEAGVLRELYEELGLTIEELDLFALRYVTTKYTQNEVRIQYFFFARIKEKRTLTSIEGTLAWFSREELSPLPMPKTAQEVLMHYETEGQLNDYLYAIAVGKEEVNITKLER